MAKVRLNPLIEGIHGKIGGLIFRGAAHGDTVVYKALEKAERKTRTEPGSPLHPFTRAHIYARAAMADPALKTFYEKEGKQQRRSAYSMAFSRYFKIHRKSGE